jgi:hypothetical protein
MRGVGLSIHAIRAQYLLILESRAPSVPMSAYSGDGLSRHLE